MHLSDLHIGIKLMNYDLKEEQQYVFQQIIEYAKEERPDAVLIAGDTCDESDSGGRGSGTAGSVCYHVLHEALPEGQIMMISGNHDSQQRGRLLQRAFAQAEHSYGRDASQNTERKN